MRKFNLYEFENVRMMQKRFNQPLYVVLSTPSHRGEPPFLKAVYFDNRSAEESCCVDDNVFKVRKDSDYSPIIQYYDVVAYL